MSQQKVNYNLTFWQKVSLPLIWFFWVTAPPEKRKTWHLVKKGMERHTCEWEETPYQTEYLMYDILKWYRCKHEGCNVVNPISERTFLGKELDNYLNKYKP